MADLSLNVLPDLSGLKNQISDVAEDATNVEMDVTGQGGAGGGGDGRNEGLLGTLSRIIKPLLAIAAFAALLKPVQDAVELVVGLLSFLIFRTIQGLAKGIRAAVSWLTSVNQRIKTLQKKFLKGLLNLAVNIGTTIANWIGQAITWISQLPGKIAQAIVGFFQTIWGLLKQVGRVISTGLTKTWQAITGALQTAWQTITRALNFLKTALAKAIGTVVDTVSKWLGQAVNFLSTLPGDIWAAIKEGFQTVKNTLSGLPSEIGSFVTDALSGLRSAITGISDDVGDAVEDVVDTLNPFSEDVDDAIITSDGRVINTNPNDTIIATQNPGQQTGGGGKTLNFYGVQPDEVVETVKRELGTTNIRSGGRQ